MPKLLDEFKTIIQPTESLFKDKGSKFFGFAFPVQNESEIKENIEQIKALHPKARHHCYAYKLGIDDTNFRANDDGEPSGSAGKPILNTIQSFDFTDILVIVVRYFGGTLLGVPGLIHAYKEATREALEVAEIETKTINKLILISYDFADTNAVMQLVKKLDLTVKEQRYDTRCGLVLDVRLSLINTIREALVEYWNVTVEELEE